MHFWYIALAGLLLAGCASHQGDGMSAAVVMRDMHRCSRVSPEIDLNNVPSGTTRFDVKLENMSDPRRFHGGGTWAHDGSNTIPEGALTRHYIGACPPAGTQGSYQYVITALDEAGHSLAERVVPFTLE